MMTMTSSPSACIELKEGTHVAKCVLMPGDPLRAKYIASDGIHPTALGYREWWGHFDGVSRILGHCEPHICPVMVFPAGPITHARK